MMEKGVCYLEVINFVFSHKYCQAITFNLLESEVLPIRDHPVLAHFVEIHSSRPRQDELTATRLCTQAPKAGGRIFETGDEKLLQLAHETQSAFFTTTVLQLCA